MSIFERYLTVWVGLAMIAGVLIGKGAPWLVQAIAATEVASVNLVVAVLIWAMVYPDPCLAIIIPGLNSLNPRRPTPVT